MNGVFLFRFVFFNIYVDSDLKIWFSLFMTTTAENIIPIKVQFKVGETYSATAACDSDCHFKFTVIRRTEKSLWLKDLSGIKKEVYRVKIQNFDNAAEVCSPLGNYAMAPLLKANRK